MLISHLLQTNGEFSSSEPVDIRSVPSVTSECKCTQYCISAESNDHNVIMITMGYALYAHLGGHTLSSNLNMLLTDTLQEEYW